MAETYSILVCSYSLRQNQYQIDLTSYNSQVDVQYFCPLVILQTRLIKFVSQILKHVAKYQKK